MECKANPCEPKEFLPGLDKMEAAQKRPGKGLGNPKDLWPSIDDMVGW